MSKNSKTSKRDQRLAEAFGEARRIVSGGKCPHCGRKLKRNLAIAGWYMCAQKGAEGFREDPKQPPCDFQCFTQ